jgi:hypothetical protein
VLQFAAGKENEREERTMERVMKLLAVITRLLSSKTRSKSTRTRKLFSRISGSKSKQIQEKKGKKKPKTPFLSFSQFNCNNTVRQSNPCWKFCNIYNRREMKERERERERELLGAAELGELATVGEDDKGNFNVTQNGKLEGFLEQTVPSLWEGNLAVDLVLYPLQHHSASPHALSLSLSFSLSLSLSLSDEYVH